LSYEQANGVVKDEARAAALYTKACDTNMAQACVSLGHLFAEGRGVARDEARAARAHARGCVLKDGLSCKKTRH
jgi:TPR repeat protein